MPSSQIPQISSFIGFFLFTQFPNYHLVSCTPASQEIALCHLTFSKKNREWKTHLVNRLIQPQRKPCLWVWSLSAIAKRAPDCLADSRPRTRRMIDRPLESGRASALARPLCISSCTPEITPVSTCFSVKEAPPLPCHSEITHIYPPIL